MPSDVRKMSDKRLDGVLRELFAEIWANGFGVPDYEMFPQKSAEVCDELARRLSILREYCQAEQAKSGFMGGDIAPLIWRLDDARVAYRQMEAERNAE